MKRCDHFTHEGFGHLATECVQCTPNLNRPISAPPAISYSEAMQDSRKLRWIALSKSGYVVEFGVTYIGARYSQETGVWQLGRVQWCECCGHWEMVQEGTSNYTRCHSKADITHYCDDVLGTP